MMAQIRAGRGTIGLLLQFLILVVALGVVAALSPAPWWRTDQLIYDRLARDWIVPGCSEIHCFRALVPWALSLLPGAALLKWKTYAVVCEAGAALAMGRLVVQFGASPRSGRQVTWLTAFGAGSLYTLFDPHTSDPLMHLLGPLLLIRLLQSRLAEASSLAAVGVFAKEFAAVPLWIVMLLRAQQGRWTDARSLLAAAVAVTALWAGWHVALVWGFGYSNGPTPSADFFNGAYLAFWLAALDPATIVSSIAMVFGALWVCWPAGLLWGGRELRQLTLAATPAVLVWCALQQPERALWNYALLVMPAAAVVLDRVPASLGWSLVAVQGVADLRLGAQLAWAPAARFTLPVAGLLALVAVWRARPGRAAEAASVS